MLELIKGTIRNESIKYASRRKRREYIRIKHI